jgi:hypothetical protein
MPNDELRRRAAEYGRRPWIAAARFVEAVKAHDPEALIRSLEDVDHTQAWKLVFKGCKKLADVSHEVRMAFLDVWVRHGVGLREEVNDDRLFVAGLRVLLPPYTGPALDLYRGDGFANRKYRTYGLSWSTDEGMADGFARGVWRTTEGGSVLLRVNAQPDAIICDTRAFPAYQDLEHEVIVDPRKLRGVTVVRRYSQIELETLMAQMHQDD